MKTKPGAERNLKEVAKELTKNRLTEHQRQTDRRRILCVVVVIAVGFANMRRGSERRRHNYRITADAQGGCVQSGMLGGDQVRVQRPDSLRNDDGQCGADEEAGAEYRNDAEFRLKKEQVANRLENIHRRKIKSEQSKTSGENFDTTKEQNISKEKTGKHLQ